MAVSAYPDLERHCVATEVACERKCHRHGLTPFRRILPNRRRLVVRLVCSLAERLAHVKKSRLCSRRLFYCKIFLTFCVSTSIINACQKVGGDLSPRTGRPKVEKPKSVNYSVRLDVETEQRLREYCQEHSITRGEAIRRGIHLLLEQKK